MKGIILAGGRGTRLGMATEVTNKHLLCCGSFPMIYYPLQTLRSAEIEDILIVTGAEHMGDFMELLGGGSRFGVNFIYRVQESPGGIAEALLLGESFANDESIAVILGDNYFEDIFAKDVEDFCGGAKIFLKEVPDPERFGIADIKKNKIIKITEKPQKPKSNLAVTGFYLYDWNVFDYIKEQEYSLRRELEISDTNNKYLENGDLDYRILKGFWSDMGTPNSLLKTSIFLANKEVKDKEELGWLK